MAIRVVSGRIAPTKRAEPWVPGNAHAPHNAWWRLAGGIFDCEQGHTPWLTTGQATVP
jgi:hypothetical protein